MQWLIDLIVEAIGVPPTFIDRGDPAVVDFDKDDLTQNNAWHDLDLSGIIPSNATAVLLTIEIDSVFTQKKLWIRKNGNANTINKSQILTAVANGNRGADFTVPVGTDGIIEYLTSVPPWTRLDITVKGWWL